MGDNWELEAVKEHFSVFKSSRHLQQVNVDTNNYEKVVKVVNEVLKLHLQPKTDYGKELLRNITVQIISKHSGNVTFNFIVIVTDQKYKGQLCKIPIFVIQFGNEKVFIVKGSYTFKSWNALMENSDNVLPNCNISFPVDGYYRNDSKLRINFKKCSLIQNSYGWSTFAKWGISLVAVAATALLNATPYFALCKPLMKLAGQFTTHIDHKWKSLIFDLMTLIKRARTDKMDALVVLPDVFNILQELNNEYKDEIEYMADAIKKTFWKAWQYISNLFSFKSKSVPTRLLSIVGGTNGENVENNSYSQNIFENCQNESVYNYNTKIKSNVQSQDLDPITKSMISVTKSIAYKVENVRFPSNMTSENDVSRIFLAVKKEVQRKAEQDLANYKTAVDTINKFSSQPIDIEAINKSLGIEGDPKTHFFMKSLDSIDQSPMIKYLMLQNHLKHKEQEPASLLQFVMDPNNDKLGIYRLIGEGKGLVSPKSIIKAISKIFDINENDFVEKEENDGKSSKITLLFGSYKSAIYQKVNEDNDVEGMVVML